MERKIPGHHSERPPAGSEPPTQPDPRWALQGFTTVQTWAKCCLAELGLGLSVARPNPWLPLKAPALWLLALA